MSRYIVRVVQRDGVARYVRDDGALTDDSHRAREYADLESAQKLENWIRSRFDPANIITDIIAADDPERGSISEEDE